jgi:hypothetical protein
MTLPVLLLTIGPVNRFGAIAAVDEFGDER